MTETPIEPYEVTLATPVVPEATTFPFNLKIDVSAVTQRELLVQLFNIYNLYNSAGAPPNAAHDSAEHSWHVEYTS